ncbi:hypothetical protein [Bordetella sp. 2513F-2]
MNNPVFAQTASIAFSVLTACLLVSAVSGLVLFFLRPGRINTVLKHPYLEHRPFSQYPFAIRAAISLDYFFRLVFPRIQFWLIGHANRQLQHVEPKRVPLDVKLPVIGFWGGCWVGLAAMVVLWTVLLLSA